MATQEPLKFDASSLPEASQQRIDELLAAVARHPAAAAEVLKAADAVLVDNNAYAELDFGEVSERKAEKEVKPADRLRQATSDTERGRVISANIIARTWVHAAHLAEEAASDSDLPQSA